MKAAIFGFAGTSLSEKERKFFKEANPFGFIVFARNLKEPEQIKRLTAELRELSGNAEIPILIDQEGGRVARLKPPHFRKSLPAGVFFALAKKDLEKAKKAVYLNSRLIAAELYALGINVDCAPVADILFPEAHDIIGDRAFGEEAAMVATLAEQMCHGLGDGNIMPIIKHIPGHGRAAVDSHHDLPVVNTDLATLDRTDFEVFRKLRNMPWAMTAHITYTAIDDKEPATLSAKVINTIRKEIGFDGLLLTDDLSMKALKNSFAARSKKSLEAGCDIILHCNGDMGEMEEIAENTPAISDEAAARIAKGKQFLKTKPGENFDSAEWEKELAELIGNA